MAEPSRRFAFYPTPKAADKFDYDFKQTKNPALRGLPLAVGASVVTSLSFLPRYLFNNAGFGTIKHMPELRDVDWRALSLVVPLADPTSTTKMLDFTPDHLAPQPAALPGRFHSAADYTTQYRSGQLTPLQVVNGLLALITDRSSTGGSEHPVAWAEVRPDEVRAAAEASTQRWAAGTPLGPLDGVPIGVKCDTALRGHAKSLGLRRDAEKTLFRPVDESVWCVAKLVEAGAIPMGTLAMHEIGIDMTGCNPALGTPRNWYNKLYYPGGSSSGAASTLGAGVVPIAVGTDAAGSLRVPAAYNGVYSLKPTFGRIEYKHSSVCVVGPMAGTASDLAIAYRIMAQPDPAGGTTSQFAPSLPPRRASAESKKYIGVCRPWVGQSIPFVLDTFNKAIEFLASKAGYETIDIDLPWLQQGQLSLSAMCLVEAAERAHARAEKPAHWLSLYNAPNRVLLSVGEQAGAEDYIKCGQLRELIMQHLASLWRRYPGMLVLSPMTPGVGWPVHPGDQKYGFSDGNVTITNMTYAWLANLAGCPAVSCPMGYGEPAQGEGKVPVGVQAMGEWGEEERLLLFAKDAERWLNEGSEGGRLRPKEWVDVLELARKASGANVQGKGGEESEGTTGGK